MLVIANETMKLGVSNDVNRNTHKASLRLMDGGSSKINPSNSHPSNQIHKQATEAQRLAVKKKPTTTTTQTLATTTQAPATNTQTPSQELTTDPVDPHHVNKALVALGALALVGFVIWAGR